MKKYVSRCSVCNKKKNGSKRRPYGTTGTISYCHSCDIGCPYKVSKSGHRGKVKKEIKKILREIQPWTIKLIKSKDDNA